MKIFMNISICFWNQKIDQTWILLQCIMNECTSIFQFTYFWLKTIFYYFLSFSLLFFCAWFYLSSISFYFYILLMLYSIHSFILGNPIVNDFLFYLFIVCSWILIIYSSIQVIFHLLFFWFLFKVQYSWFAKWKNVLVSN